MMGILTLCKVILLSTFVAGSTVTPSDEGPTVNAWRLDDQTVVITQCNPNQVVPSPALAEKLEDEHGNTLLLYQVQCFNS